MPLTYFESTSNKINTYPTSYAFYGTSEKVPALLGLTKEINSSQQLKVK